MAAIKNDLTYHPDDMNEEKIEKYATEKTLRFLHAKRAGILASIESTSELHKSRGKRIW